MNDIEILEQQAIDAAMHQKWDDAVRLNEKVLALDNKNLSACLRQGFAHLQQKEIEKAKKYYVKALRIQPKNHVAEENLERIEVLSEQGTKKTGNNKTVLRATLFLEIPGKTKSVALVNVGQKNDLAELVAGEVIELKQKKRKIEARTKEGDYIGCLPDDLSKRLMYFVKQKSEYIAYVKEASLNKVVLFIKEITKGKKVAHFLSFPQNVQSNLEHMNDDGQPHGAAETEDEESGDDEWENIENELTPGEKEVLIDIHQDEDEVEE